MDIYFGGDYRTGTYNPGTYTVEVRAWADNNIDTEAIEELIVTIVDPCIAIMAPASPLPSKIYLIGSGMLEFDV